MPQDSPKQLAGKGVAYYKGAILDLQYPEIPVGEPVEQLPEEEIVHPIPGKAH